MSADRCRAILLSGFGTGYAPVASGTFGTLPGVALAVVLGAVLPAPALGPVLLGLALVLFVWACTQSAFIARTWPKEDPGTVVLDEIVGYLVALGILALVVGTPGTWAHVLGFVAFRAFDVLKVPPADRLEEIDGAVGIMADDVAAGVYTALVLLLADAAGLLT
jgi:phosphatidylglycerophosphatase A